MDLYPNNLFSFWKMFSLVKRVCISVSHFPSSVKINFPDIETSVLVWFCYLQSISRSLALFHCWCPYVQSSQSWYLVLLSRISLQLCREAHFVFVLCRSLTITCVSFAAQVMVSDGHSVVCRDDQTLHTFLLSSCINNESGREQFSLERIHDRVHDLTVSSGFTLLTLSRNRSNRPDTFFIRPRISSPPHLLRFLVP